MYIFYERMRSECIKFGVSVGLESKTNNVLIPFIAVEFWHSFFTWSLERGKNEIRKTEKEQASSVS